MSGPKDVILGWGDWSKETMRFHEPTKGRGMRSLFKRASYQLFLVNEYNTSGRCYGCSGGACVNSKRWRILASGSVEKDLRSCAMGCSGVQPVSGFGTGTEMGR